MAVMRVGDLLEALMELDEELEIAIVTQPSYPITHEVTTQIRHDQKRVYLFEGLESWYSGSEAEGWSFL